MQEIMRTSYRARCFKANMRNRAIAGSTMLAQQLNQQWFHVLRLQG